MVRNLQWLYCAKFLHIIRHVKHFHWLISASSRWFLQALMYTLTSLQSQSLMIVIYIQLYFLFVVLHFTGYNRYGRTTNLCIVIYPSVFFARWSFSWTLCPILMCSSATIDTLIVNKRLKPLV